MDVDEVNKYNTILCRLRQIENFTGSEPQQLAKFVTQIESVMPLINSFDEYNSQSLFAFVKNKCTDQAKELVISRPQRSGDYVESWPKLKELLLYHYGEREHLSSLMHKVRGTVLDSTIEQYYQKISKLRQRALNRRLTHNDTLYSAADVERITLQAFRNHLPEPTHTMVLRRNPSTLDEAYRYIVEAQQQYYTQAGPIHGEGNGFSCSSAAKRDYLEQRAAHDDNNRTHYDGIGLALCAGSSLHKSKECHAGLQKYGKPKSYGGSGGGGGGGGPSYNKESASKTKSALGTATKTLAALHIANSLTSKPNAAKEQHPPSQKSTESKTAKPKSDGLVYCKYVVDMKPKSEAKYTRLNEAAMKPKDSKTSFKSSIFAPKAKDAKEAKSAGAKSKLSLFSGDGKKGIWKK